MNKKYQKEAKGKISTPFMIGMVGVVLIAVGAIFYTTQLRQSDPSVRIILNTGESKVTKTNKLEGLYPTYTSLEEMLKRSDIAFVGKAVVTDNGTTIVRTINVGIEGFKDRKNVNTEYELSVEQVFRGKNIPSKVTISLMGGIVDDTRYYFEGVPQLRKGDSVVVFATLGDDGKYYPLSGSTAVATAVDGGRFKLTGSTINTGEVIFSETELKEKIK